MYSPVRGSLYFRQIFPDRKSALLLTRYVLLLLIYLLAVNAILPAEPAPGSTTQTQLITDPMFSRGFNLLGIRSIETGTQVLDILNYGNSTAAPPAWRLAQWGTRHSLKGAKLESTRPGEYRYANPGKAVTIDTQTGELVLAAFASNEYDSPRVPNQEWPHLLIEQYFHHRPLISELQELRMQLKVTLSQFTDQMTSETFDPTLHAAQLQLYLMVQNCDTSSTSHGDYFWFGMALFDNREAVPKEAWHKDGGKQDTTHKFIYIMPSRTFLLRGLIDGIRASVDVDVLPYIIKARQLARAEGFLTGTADEQLAVTSMNLGWELPGTFDVEARVHDLALVAHTSKEK